MDLQTEQMQKILAIVRRDCAAKLRISYMLNRNITESDLDLFVGYSKHINRFSQIIATAKDHFVLIQKDPYVHVTGSINDKTLVITYGKPTLNDTHVDRTPVEKIIINGGFGDEIVVYRPPVLEEESDQ